ncbi:MAG: hypothetical protein U9Q81_25765 [Pseudomonadota bacterium]|nr:hypothetical protein [Pseudomonadota bacterium]
MFIYENADGQRVVLYVCQNENQDRNTAFRFASEEWILFANLSEHAAADYRKGGI